MKKTLVYSLGLLLFGSVMLQSCGPTETAEPILVVTSFTDGWDAGSQTFTGDIGDVLELEISVDAEGIFNTARVLDADGTVLQTEARTDDGQTIYNGTFSYTLKEEEAGQTITLTVEGVDDEARTVSETVTIVTGEMKTAVVKYTARLLYSPLESKESKTFLSTDDGETYSRNDVETTADPVSPKIDFGYYFGNSDKASIASPMAYPTAIYDLSAWGSTNDTKLKLTEMPVEHFTDIENNDDIATHWAMTDMADADGDVINLSVDNLVAFELDSSKGSKKGFFLVKTIVGEFGTDDYIEIDVIIEGEE